MRLAVLGLCLAAIAAADEMEVWQTLDAPLVERGRFFGVIHTQFRTRPDVRQYHQARVGPVFRIRVNETISAVAGYYFGEVEQKVGWGNNHRTFGGLETPFAWRGQTFNVRSLAEHHFGGEDPPELRIREQLQIVRRIAGPVAGIVATETFFDQKGFFQQRVIGGVRLPFLGRYRMDVTYFYDARLERAGPGRHVIQTAFRPSRRER